MIYEITLECVIHMKYNLWVSHSPIHDMWINCIIIFLSLDWVNVFFYCEYSSKNFIKRYFPEVSLLRVSYGWNLVNSINLILTWTWAINAESFYFPSRGSFSVNVKSTSVTPVLDPDLVVWSTLKVFLVSH